jgi:hypothetical protein
VWSEQGGIPAIVRFMNQWAELARRRTGVGIVRYEDFLTQPAATLRKLTDLVGFEVNDSDIEDAVEFGSLPNLKQREREGYFQSSRLQAAKKDDAASYKVRSGSSGGYRERLEPENVAKVDAYIGANLDPIFGY